MTTSISRRDWLKRSSMAAAILPISSWYNPIAEDYINEKRGAPGALRLNANENPYGPSEAAKKAIMESLSEANRYPRDHMDKLREAVAKKENVTSKHILLTAGSTELLGLTGLDY